MEGGGSTLNADESTAEARVCVKRSKVPPVNLWSTFRIKMRSRLSLGTAGGVFSVTVIFLGALLVAGAAWCASERTGTESVASQTRPVAPPGGHLYVLGPDDVLTFQVRDAEEFQGHNFRIGGDGLLYLPLIGAVRAAGKTVVELQSEVQQRLGEFIREPEVVVQVVEYRSQPVSVLGQVNNPGVIQVEGRKRLLEVLSMAGGLKPDASDKLKITRQVDMGPIPVPGATLDPTGKYYIAEIDLTNILEAQNPAENIEVKPFDVITVPKAKLVYVIGEVNRPGGFVIEDKEKISVLTALSLAQGFTRLAAPGNARLLRVANGQTERVQIPVNLKRIVQGKAEDILLMPEDVLVVPSSKSREAFDRLANTGLGILAGIIVWRR